jgi:hypothetical protein
MLAVTIHAMSPFASCGTYHNARRFVVGRLAHVVRSDVVSVLAAKDMLSDVTDASGSAFRGGGGRAGGGA